jgi:hypothetical protein
MIENTVYQILSNIPALAGVIDSKIYYEHNPSQNEAQYLIYQKTSQIRPLNINGDGAIEEADFQVDIYSKSEDTARTIREALVTALHGQSNNDYTEQIQQVFISSDFSGYDSENSTYRITLTINLFFIKAEE